MIFLKYYLITLSAMTVIWACNGSGFNQKSGVKPGVEPGNGEQITQQKDGAPLGQDGSAPLGTTVGTNNNNTTTPNNGTLAPGSEPVDVAGAFLAGGFVSRENGQTTIGYDVYSDKDFKTKHVPPALDDVLRPKLPNFVTIGEYDSVAGSFKPFSAAIAVTISSPPLDLDYHFGFKVPDDKSHLLTLKYDDGLTVKYVPVNNPTVFPLNVVNFQLTFGTGPTSYNNQYAISADSSGTSVWPKKFDPPAGTIGMDNQNLRVSVVNNNMFQIVNLDNFNLGVLPNSENSSPDLILANSKINALPGGASLPKILSFGAVQDPAINADNKTMYLKLGQMFVRSDYYICIFNNYLAGFSHKSEMYIAIPASVLSTAVANDYLKYCDTVEKANMPPSRWRTSLEWW